MNDSISNSPSDVYKVRGSDDMAEVVHSLGQRVTRVESDIGGIKIDQDDIKEDQRRIMKTQDKILEGQTKFEVAFSDHCIRDEETKSIMRELIDGVKNAVEKLADTQSEHSKKLVEIEMQSKFDNLEQEKKALENKLAEREKGFWGMAEQEVKMWVIKGFLALTALGIAGYVAKLALVQPIINAIPK